MTPRLLYTINEACAALGVKRTSLYQLMAEGLIDARKLGGKTMIVAESLGRFVEGLPKAEIKDQGRGNIEQRQVAAELRDGHVRYWPA